MPKTPTTVSATPAKVISAPKVGGVAPEARPRTEIRGTKYNPIGHLGDYAHPPKSKGKKK